MNLNSYDNVTEPLDKTKTWIDVKSRTLLSKEITYRKYICVLKRYIPRSNSYNYYIALLNEPPIDRKCKPTKLDDYGRIKVDIRNIWKHTSLVNIKVNINVNCELVNADDDGEIYFLDI